MGLDDSPKKASVGLNHFHLLGDLIKFQQAVKETKAERPARGFTCWGQFVAMLFCQLGRAQSLREIAGGLRSCEGKWKRLGISAPSLSTLAYAKIRLLDNVDSVSELMKLVTFGK
jgi:hypothetical protein